MNNQQRLRERAHMRIVHLRSPKIVPGTRKRLANMRQKSKFSVLWSSKRQDWKTPEYIFNLLNSEFHFDFDPCPVEVKEDGLIADWKGSRCFVNPPFRNVASWIKKGYEESLKGKLVVFLVAARTDTRWFHTYCLPYAEDIRFVPRRLRFSESKNSAPFPSMIVIFDGRMKT